MTAAAIAYDKPVTNLIAELDKTGHVSHVAFKKTSVTLHHNGGRLSHQGVLNVWKVRPASAHFDVDGYGNVAQYVGVSEYAWAVGNTYGNEVTISIEMCNQTLEPDWKVSETTWKSAARLAGWLFFKVVGERPSSSNFFVHHHWAATDCAGPFIDSQWSAVVAEAQHWYDYFKGQKPPTPKPPAPTPTPVLRVGSTGDAVRHLQQFLRNVFPAYKDSVSVQHGHLISVDGVFGPQTKAWVMEFQKRVGITIDGVVGPQTTAKLHQYGY